MRSHLSFANALSVLALFIALSGGAYAAAVLPRNSVGPRQLQTGSVTSAKVKDGTLRRRDFRPGQLAAPPQGSGGQSGPAGPKGDAGAAGAAGAPGIGLNGFFGSGSDGDENVAFGKVLTRDTYWHDLTLQPGAGVNTQGWRLFVSGTLTLGDGSRISRDGNNGNQGFGGQPLVAGSLGGAGAGGGNSCGPAAGATFNSLGGSGGSTAACGAGGTAGRPGEAAGGARAFDGAVAALSGRTLDATPVTGGAGGRGGNLTGGGGGGGVVIVAARVVRVTGSASITANGGNSAGGDSAGGGGGVVVVISTSAQPGGVTLSANGGTGTLAGSVGYTRWIN
jgi:hypothetical protein